MNSNKTPPTTPVNMTNTDETTIVNRVTNSNETPISQSNFTTLAPARLDNLNDASFNGSSDNVIRPKEVVAIQPFQPVPLRIDNSSDATNLNLKTDNSSRSSLPIGLDQNQEQGSSKIFNNNNDTLSEPAPRAR